MTICRTRTRISSLCLLIGLASGFSQAAPATQDTAQPLTDTIERAQPEKTNTLLAERAGYVATILATEMAAESGQSQEAFNTYRALFLQTHDPAIAERAFNLALLNGQPAAAYILFNEWKSAHLPPSPEFRRSEFIMACIMKDTTTASRLMPQALQSPSREQLALIYTSLMQLAAAKPSFATPEHTHLIRQAASKPNTTPAATFANAFFSTLSNQRSQAFAALKEIERFDSDFSNSRTQWLVAQLYQKRPALIQAYFRQGTHANGWGLAFAHTLYQEQHYAQALQQYEAVAAKVPSAIAYIGAARAASRLNKPLSTIIPLLNHAIEIGNDKEKNTANLIAGYQLSHEKQYAEAERHLKQVSDQDFGFDKWLTMALIANDQNNWSQAQRYLSRAKAFQSWQANPAHSERDWLAAKLTASQHAARPDIVFQQHNALLKEYEAQSPQDPSILAMIHYSKGNYYVNQLADSEKALAEFETANRLMPDTPYIQNNLGYTLLSLPEGKRNIQRGYELIRKAWQQDKTSPVFNDSLGWALFLMQRPREALIHLESAWRNEKNAVIGAHLGEVLWQLGKRQDALTIWQQAQALPDSDHTLANTLQRLNIQLPPQ